MVYTIVIAEDNPDIVELLRLYLSIKGYNVVSVDNGIDALEITENQKN